MISRSPTLRTFSASALTLVALLGPAACSDDDAPPTDPVGSAGTAGAAGNASGGNAGSPSAGSGGNAGNPSAGSGGDAGNPSAGSGGNAGSPSAGSGGNAGNPSAGSGGDAGNPSAGSGGDAGNPSAGSGGDAGSAAGGGEAGGGQSGGGGSGGDMVKLLSDLSIAKTGGGTWPHAIDVYGSPQPARALVLLHGGSGKKESIVQSFGLVKDGVIDAAWLVAHQLAVIVPQGQRNTSEGVDTWTNGVMISGADDQAFLVDLAAKIRLGGLGELPAIARVYVAGHSNGGMMSNWMWCRSPTTFDAYGALAGPAAKRLDLNGTAPCAPAVARPYLGFVGSADIVLRTTGKWDEPVWTISPTLTSNELSWDDPDLVNEERFTDTVRVKQVCDGAAPTPTTSADGTRTSWTACAGSVRLERINGASHGIDSLEETSGLSLKTELLQFFEASESK
jgi:polyhydroxybutyrate depolymerase